MRPKIKGSFPMLNKAGKIPMEYLPDNIPSENNEMRIINTATGSVITTTDSAEAPLQSMKIYGKTTQAGTPTPENPIELVSVGDSGSTTEYVMGGNLFNNDTSLLKKVTCTENSQGGQKTRIGYEPIVLPAGTYTFTLTDLDTSLVKYVYGIINDKDGKFVRECRLLQNTVNFTPLTITVNEGDKIYIYDGHADLNITERSKTFKAVQIHLNAGSVAKPYEPYTEQSLTLSTPNGLPGIPVSSDGNYTDASGQQWVCDEVDFERGVLVQRTYKYVCTGDEDWKFNAAMSSAYNRYDAAVSNIPLPVGNAASATKCMCTHSVSLGNTVTNRQNCWVVNSIRNVGLRMVCSILTSDDFKQMLKDNYASGTPVTFVYELAEPIETPLTDEEIAAYKALHTYKPNTTIYNSEGADMEVDYVADTKLYIDNKIEKAVAELSAAIITE